MREISKKAQSEIIVTILLILLVLVAIFIIYSVIMSVIKGGAEDIDSEIMTVQLGIVEDSVYIDYSDPEDPFNPLSNDGNKLQLSVSRGSDKANVSSIKIVVLGEDESGNDRTYIETRTINIPQPLEYRIYVLDITGFLSKSITKITVYPVSPKGKVGIGYVYNVKPTEQETSPGGGSGGGGWYTEDPQTGNTGGPGGTGEEPPCTTNGCSVEGVQECTTDYKYHTCVNTGSCLEWVSGDCDEELCVNGVCVPQVRNYFKDSDGDYWSDGTQIDTNEPPVGYYLPAHFSSGGQNEDCDDTNSAIHPGVTESCNDNIDNNCAMGINEGCCKLKVLNSGTSGCDNYRTSTTCLVPKTCVDATETSVCPPGGNYYTQTTCELLNPNPDGCSWKSSCSWG